ncbi:cell division protein ZapA [Niameybacter massiliensis]|uniref:Cell division protein ZapA n=1 Tax=Holtiella tumoricola TaxID=3018743 RepID=A0AA42J1I6_9FIRM|nr:MULTISPECIES: cell division protein ZapA [Lachnospirales]MDA3732425.1 cell division protein ZapA [Holtiella tumoricola]
MTKNKVEVIIGGQVFALQGNESQEHIQKVASVLDQKVLEIHKQDPMHKLSSAQKHMMAALNMADEYLKMKTDLERFSQELEKCNAENLALLERIEEMSLEMNRLKIMKRRK